MLQGRLAGTAAIILPTIGLLWLDHRANFGYPGTWLVLIGALLVFAGVWEMTCLLEESNPRERLAGVAVPSLICAGGMWAGVILAPRAGYSQLGSYWLCIVAAIWLSFASVILRELTSFAPRGNFNRRTAAIYSAIGYVMVPISFMLGLRLLAPDIRGLLALVSVVFVVKGADAGAYFVGRACGRHKMAPVISPGKTWEGAAGAFLFAAGAAWFYHQALCPWLLSAVPTTSAWRWIVYGVVLALAGMLGDLAESMLKRDAGVKDSGDWLPGLGGALDVLDSLLWAAPVAYAIWASDFVHW